VLTQSHRAIWFDNRGAGEVDTTRVVTVAEMAADAMAVMGAAGVECAHMYGVSMGGGIAGEFAIRYPERAISLVLDCTRM
jgi:3-oxoadipate enol-lactonase